MGLSVTSAAVGGTCSVVPACQTEPWSGEAGLLGSLFGPLLLDRFALLLLVVRLRDLAWHIVLPDLGSYAAVVGAAESSTSKTTHPQSERDPPGPPVKVRRAGPGDTAVPAALGA
jgi:hypothetical protein